MSTGTRSGQLAPRGNYGFDVPVVPLTMTLVGALCAGVSGYAIFTHTTRRCDSYGTR